MRNRMTLRNFALRCGFNRSNVAGFKESLRHLEEAGALKVKQGGFLGHSTCHPRIVYVYDWNVIKQHFGDVKTACEVEPEHCYEERDKREEYSEYALSFCISPKPCGGEFNKENLPYPICRVLHKCRHRIGARLNPQLVKAIINEMYPPDERALFFNC